jgi:hypothetical protein
MPLVVLVLTFATIATPTTPAAFKPLQLRLQLIRRCPSAAECAAPGVVVDMKRETQRIWSPQGVQLVWIDSFPADPLTRTLIDLVIMFEEHPDPFVGGSHHDSLVLGRTNLPETPCDAGVVHLWVANVRRHIEAVQVRGLPWVSVPPRFTEPLLGRALGRALAHEIGHYLFGAGHARDGLMRARFTAEEMVEPTTAARYGLDETSRATLAVRESSFTMKRCVTAARRIAATPPP